jgi:purine-binding chemotaxis protein CheW
MESIMQDIEAVIEGEDVEREESQFVTFMVDGEIFAAPMGPVQEIIRVPDLARVPLAPHSLLGLSNLRGRVLPIVDLRRIFGLAEEAQTDATRALVINFGSPLGFVVDRVSSVIAVNNADIEPVSSIRSSMRDDLLTGVVRGQNGQLIMVLDFQHIIRQEFEAILQGGRAGGTEGTFHSQVEEEGEFTDTDELQLVSFSVCEQEYAADISAVQEIVQMPERVVAVPNAPHHVLGLMTLRERLLPLVSLRALLNLPSHDGNGLERVVVLGLGDGNAVGVVADTVDEVLRVPRSLVEALPSLLAQGGGIEEISSICRLDSGRRLVSVIDTARMFASAAFQAALNQTSVAEKPMYDQSAMEGEDDLVEDEEQVVVFRLGSEEFGVPIATVQEIVRVPEQLTHVPKAPGFVEGVINLRGSVLPVMDQRRRLGLDDVARNDRQRIMVYVLDGKRMGFIVDAVSEVLKIPRNAIETAPRLSGEQQKILGRVANLEKQHRMIMLVDPAALLSGTEMAALSKAA